LSRVAVVGGGITGLAAAHRLAQAGAEVVVVESSERLGGKIWTHRSDEVISEAGPDSFLDREPWATSLCHELGLGPDLVAPAHFGALIWTGKRLGQLPPGWPHGIPVSPYRAWRSGLLSAPGALRAYADLFQPRRLSGPDLSVASFVVRRFGPEVLEALVDPLLAGTRAGQAESLSLAAATPPIDSLARKNRSLILGLHSHAPSGPPPFLGIRGGMDRLVERLAGVLEGRARLQTGTIAQRLCSSSRGFELRLEPGASIEAEAVILAVPSYAAAGLVTELSPRAAAHLKRIAHATVVSATLVFEPGAWAPPEDTSGLLVSRKAGRLLAACSWSSHKWPEGSPADGSVVVRCFAGRAGRHPAFAGSDQELTRRLAEDLRAVVGIDAPLVHGRITRWERGLPEYRVGHLELVAAAERALAGHFRVALAGSSYRGSGLPDCIRQGQEAAERVLAQL
jgi:protoporphyrinogen/coproporphyrinogen III oxidase